MTCRTCHGAGVVALATDSDEGRPCPDCERCPQCGGTFTIDEHAETDVLWFRPNIGGMPYLDTTRRRAIVAFCNTCEFALELSVNPSTVRGENR